MVVRYMPAPKGRNKSLIADFLLQNSVPHELIEREKSSLKEPWSLDGEIVEVDGRIFVNPNPDALRKILHLEIGSSS